MNSSLIWSCAFHISFLCDVLLFEHLFTALQHNGCHKSVPRFKVTLQQNLTIRSSALEFIMSTKQTVLETGQLTH